MEECMKSIIAGTAIVTILSLSMAAAGTDSCVIDSAKCPHHDKSRSGIHYFMLGGALVDNSEVNQRMSRLGYGEFSRYGFSIGFGGLRTYRRYVKGGEFEGMFWKRSKKNGTESRFTTGRFLSLHGFSLVSSPNISLYPLIGIGGGVTSLWAGPKEVPFDSAFAIPSQLPESSPLHQLSFLIDLGFGLQFSRPIPHGRPGRMAIGIRAGYIFDPVDNDRWYRNGTRLTGGPDSDLSGPYLRLTLGGSRTGKCRGKGECPQKEKWNREGCKMRKAE